MQGRVAQVLGQSPSTCLSSIEGKTSMLKLPHRFLVLSLRTMREHASSDNE